MFVLWFWKGGKNEAINMFETRAANMFQKQADRGYLCWEEDLFQVK
jgi:hypothetical protein